jgi:ferritin-like metal-binding protein YciE
MARRTTKKSGSRKSPARRRSTSTKRSVSARKSTARKSSGRKSTAKKSTARKGTKRTASKSRKQAGGRSLASRVRSAFSRGGSAEPKQLSDLFHEALKDTYMAEKQILKALPKMAKAAQSSQLRQAFETHRRETEGHAERLERVFQSIGKRAQTKHCPAIEGIIEEGEEVMSEFKGSEALDAGLIAAAQSVEHYEITRYGTLKSWAEQLGHTDAIRLIDQTLTEERRTDELLTRIAESGANRRAEAA